jgi:hypothetical protein
MKNSVKYSFRGKAVIFILIVVVSLVSCDERWAEMNTDPNRISEMPDEYLFTNAVRQTLKTQYDRFEVDFGGQYAHIWVSNNWVREADKYLDYLAQGDIAERVFDGMYNGPIRNINEVLVLTGKGGNFENPVRNAQATIIAVANFAKLVDLFGDVPYFEGGMGKYDILKPKYDKQSDIYADMIAKLKESFDVLKSGDVKKAYPAGEDPLFDGRVDYWVRFANSLRLRIAMRAKNADAAKYNAVISECLAQPLIETNLQNAKLTCWDSENGELYNPWNNYYTDISNGTYILNFGEKFINTLKETNDPRLPFFASKNKKGEYIGMPNGLNDGYYAAWSRPNSAYPTAEFFAKDQPMYFMTAAEIWFLRSEAVLEGLGTGDANEMYQIGIKRAMEQWGIKATDIQNYIADEQEATLFGDKNNKIRQIATQIWISFVPNAFESWSTIRRTGYPLLPVRDGVVLSKGVTNGVMPSRIKYPYTVEKGVNGENLEQAITNMGGDKIDIKLWWNKR